MEILVDRKIFTDKSTISEVSVDGVFECYFLEDVVREKPGVPVSEWKVPHETAIPQGRYRIERTMSARFGKVLPILIGVPGYSGVRIHPGNTEKDTEGCLLPGETKGEDVVRDSRLAFAALDQQIRDALENGEDVWIEIVGVPE